MGKEEDAEMGFREYVDEFPRPFDEGHAARRPRSRTAGGKNWGRLMRYLCRGIE